MIRRPPRSTLFPYNDALPIYLDVRAAKAVDRLLHVADREETLATVAEAVDDPHLHVVRVLRFVEQEDRKSTRLNSSHPSISYAVFCLKKKKSHCQSTTPPFAK